MVIKKFGGSSQNKPKLLKNIMDIVVLEKKTTIVVLSAIGKTTQKLLEIHNLFLENENKAIEKLDKLRNFYLNYIEELINNHIIKNSLKTFIEEIFIDLEVKKIENSLNETLSKGEIISTMIFYKYLQDNEVKSNIISTLNFMIKSITEEINYKKTKENLDRLIKNIDSNIIITQGFICLDFNEKVDNLGFEGSDFSATIIGKLLNAEKIEIWTDVDGVFDKDPKKFSNAKKIDKLTFEKAETMAKNGANILHPRSLEPLKNTDIKLYIRNTYNIENKGTLIISN